MLSNPFLDQVFFGNTIGQYILAGLILLIGFGLRTLLSKLISTFLYRVIKRYTSGVTLQELHDLLIQPLALLMFLITLYLAFNVLDYPVRTSQIAHVVSWPKQLAFHLYQIFVIASITWVVLRLIDFATLIFPEARGSRGHSQVAT